MMCQVCGKREHQETLHRKAEGTAIRVCRQCGNDIRAQLRPRQASAREARQLAAREARAKAAAPKEDDDLPPPDPPL